MASSSAIRVICVDDSAPLREALSRLLALHSDIHLVASLSRPDSLLDEARALDARVVVMDLAMDGRDAMEVLAEMAVQRPQSRVIICTGRNEPGLERRVLDAGAWGLLDKVAAPERIVQAIRDVAAGKIVTGGASSFD